MVRLIKFYIVYFIIFISLILKSEAEVVFVDSTLHLKLIKTIKGDFKDFSIDNFSNLFLISSSNQIKKLDSKYDSIAIFNDSKRFGDAFSIDVSNPLKVLVYYKDFATIVMLDRQLNIKNVIDLRQQNIFQVSAIAQSFDNKIWLFDEENNKLKKIDEYGKIILETSDFRILFEGNQSYTPNNIIEINGLLYLYQPKGGWKLFDYYGGFKTQYPFLDWQDVSVADGFLKGHDKNKFFAERPKDLQSLSFYINIDLKNTRKVIEKQNKYYILTQIGIEIYTQL